MWLWRSRVTKPEFPFKLKKLLLKIKWHFDAFHFKVYTFRYAVTIFFSVWFINQLTDLELSLYKNKSRDSRENIAGRQPHITSPRRHKARLQKKKLQLTPFFRRKIRLFRSQWFPESFLSQRLSMQVLKSSKSAQQYNRKQRQLRSPMKTSWKLQSFCWQASFITISHVFQLPDITKHLFPGEGRYRSINTTTFLK